MNKMTIICKEEENCAKIAEGLTAEGYEVTIGIVYIDYPNDDTVDQYEIEFYKK